MALKSINRASLRKSSCGLHRNGYFLPSEPWKTSFFGRWRDGITSIRSSMPANQCQSRIRRSNSASQGRTFNFDERPGERVVRENSIGTRGQRAGQCVL